MGESKAPPETAEIAEALKRAAAVLRRAEIPFALAGSVATWARGGPPPANDLDFAIAEKDADRAEEALKGAGMPTERPPEGWLIKAWDGDVLVDLIWDFEGLEHAETVLERAEELSVQAVRMPVLLLDDVIVSKLCSLDEHALDFSSPLAICRALREQVNWRSVRERTAHWPYARGFLALLQELDILPPEPGPRPGEPRVRVVPGG